MFGPLTTMQNNQDPQGILARILGMNPQTPSMPAPQPSPAGPHPMPIYTPAGGMPRMPSNGPLDKIFAKQK